MIFEIRSIWITRKESFGKYQSMVRKWLIGQAFFMRERSIRYLMWKKITGIIHWQKQLSSSKLQAKLIKDTIPQQHKNCLSLITQKKPSKDLKEDRHSKPKTASNRLLKTRQQENLGLKEKYNRQVLHKLLKSFGKGWKKDRK